MNSESYRGTAMYDGPDATVTRLMPGFEVTLKGKVRAVIVDAKRGAGDRRFDTKTEAVRWVLTCRTIAQEQPR